MLQVFVVQLQAMLQVLVMQICVACAAPAP